ncbi:MAG: DNA gyrase subunit A [Planctomycetaceae bacterium]|nr:DNA gyrase subunit A [Planctomycetaceae bacterium]
MPFAGPPRPFDDLSRAATTRMSEDSTTPEPSPDHEGADDAQAIGAIGEVVDLEIERELHDSYLTYAMSTIMDRALPDVRDGLKPSQRRILVAMNDLNLSPGRKHIKCAKIAGDTSGNYHPHGESVIYPTLVNLGQNWKTRCLLIDKQGNFGSIEGDPPAAMRYTEARMTAAAVAMLEDLKYETVDVKANYDERLMEPVVLPAKFPSLLVNGSSGIAVGMASSMPPHNAGEICDAVIRVLDDPDLPLSELLQTVPGPDFPTGGGIIGRQGIVQAYTTGRGRITVRGRVRQEIQNGRDVLVIDEIPYQVNQSSLIEKIVEAAKTGKIAEISDVRNHSGRDARTRILVVLKKGGNPDVVERQLYQFTPLQSTFSIINIALVNSQPRTLDLRALIDHWIEHRRDVIRRRTEFLLRQARQQAHKLEGLIYAVCDIDEVIRLIRSSRTRDEAISRLMERRFQIAADHAYAPLIPQRLLDAANAEVDGGIGAMLTRVQAEAIGALRLIQLTGLEIEKLAGELRSIHEEIEGYETILADDDRVRELIREDCLEIRERFADSRRTDIEDGEVEGFEMEELIQEHRVVVTITHSGWIKRLPVDTYRQQGRGGVGIKGGDAREGDFTEHVFTASTHHDLLCFTDTGRVFKIRVWQIPEAGRTSKGRSIANVLDLKDGESVRFFLPISDFEKSEDYLFFATGAGRVKRTSLKDFRNVNRSGIIALNLNDEDHLVGVVLTRGDDHVLLATSRGMAIRFDENDARVMGRAAAGVKGIDLATTDAVVGLVRAEDDTDLLTVTENGYGKRTALTEYLVQAEDGARPQSRGGKGRIDIKTAGRNGPVVTVRAVTDADSLMFISSGGMMIRTSAADVSRLGRNTQGVRVVKLKTEDRLIDCATTPAEPEEAAEDTPSPATD